MAKCESNAGESQMSAGLDSEDDLISVRDDNDCEDRAENFQDLLKSVWVGECEDEEAMLSPECQREDDNGVGEQELEEIYEFAATQRKMAQGETKVSKGTDCSICSDSETAQGTNQQTKEEEVKRSESASVSNSSKDASDVERSPCDLSPQGKKMPSMNRCSSMRDPQTPFVPPHSEPGKRDRACHGAAANEGEPARTCEDVKDSKSSQDSHDEADHCEKEFPGFHGDANRNGSYEPMFSVTQIDYCEPSPVKEVVKGSGVAPSENHVDVNDSFLYSKSQKDLPPCRNEFYGSPPPKLSVPIFPVVGSSPATPERMFARVQVSTPEQSKVEIPFPSDEVHLQKANHLDTASGKESPVSPAELPHIGLNKHTDAPVLSSPVSRAQGAAAQGNKEGDVIVLSSDDEMELEQDKRSPESGSALKNTEVPEQLKCASIEQGPEISEPEHNSSVTETDQRSTQVSCGITATVQISNCVKMSTELSLSRQRDACMESKQRPNLSPGEKLDHEMSSGTDSSWLVPDTPALSKNRSFSTQTEVSSIHSIKGPGSNLSTKDLAAGSSNHEMTGDLIQVGETTLSDKQPVENLVGEQSLPSSPAAGSAPQYSPAVSPVNPALLSPGHTNTQSKCAEAKVSFLSKSVPPCHEQSLGDKTNVSVVVVEDSEKEVSLPSASSSVLLCEEPPLPTDDCWHVEDLSPVRGSSLEPNQGSHAKTSAASSPRPGSWHDHWESPGRVQEMKGSTPLRGSPAGRTALLSPGKSPIEGCSSVGGRPSYLNSKIWDDWNGEEEDNFPEILPLSQRLTAAAGACQTVPVKTPEPSCQENEKTPSTPMTPMPAYSIMETPQLKKELSRFGVRALPKRQMVLKLKEIFQYTHQDVDSDFEGGVPSSQPPPKKSPAKRCRQPKAGRAAGGTRAARGTHAAASRAVGKRKKVATASSEAPVGMAGDDHVGSSETDCAAPKEGSKMPHHPEGAEEQKRLSVSPERWSLEDDGEEAMPSSQQSTVSSLSGSDISFGSQSSWMNGFEACAFASEEEEEEEEFSASQAAAREEEKLEAVRCYIRSNTALYHKVLFYEPIELAELHAELKQNGIKISRAKLLDFLDAQCITFTTAKARKEKEQKRKGKKKQRRY